MRAQTKIDSVMNLKEILFTVDNDLTDKGEAVLDVLMYFENPFSTEAIDASAKEIGIDPERLKEFFDENEQEKESFLSWHQEQIEEMANELARTNLALELELNAEWKIIKALKLLKERKNEKREKKEKYSKMVDEYAEKLKTHLGTSEKELSKELKSIFEFRKKYF